MLNQGFRIARKKKRLERERERVKRRQIAMEMEKEARVKTDRRGDGVVGEGLEAVEKDVIETLLVYSHFTLCLHRD